MVETFKILSALLGFTHSGHAVGGEVVVIACNHCSRKSYKRRGAKGEVLA